MAGIIKFIRSTISAIANIIILIIILGVIYLYFAGSNSHSTKFTVPQQMLLVKDVATMKSAVLSYERDYSSVYKKAEELGLDMTKFREVFGMKININISGNTGALNGVSLTFFSPVEDKRLEESYAVLLKDFSKHLEDYASQANTVTASSEDSM